MFTYLMNKYCRLIVVMILLNTVLSCKKYLDEKKDQSLAVPSTLKDLQAIIDNQNGNNGSPEFLEFEADNYYLTLSSFNFAGSGYRLAYTWNGDGEANNLSWNIPYRTVYNANFVLDNLDKINISPSEHSSYNEIKGTALFYRSNAFHQLAQLFCNPYSSNADSDPGIVLRLTAAVEVKSTRSTVQQTYNQIINDLKAAIELLPTSTIISTRPNKAAAYGLLARVYLSMRDYVNAGAYANNALMEKNTLLDYNLLTPAASPALPGFASNPEVQFLSDGFYYLLEPAHNNIDSVLYQSYNANDLRKTVFFSSNSNSQQWLGSYYPDASKYFVFDGIATDEIYLIRAECNARAGNINNAMTDLNTLLRNRWKSGTFSDLTAVDAADALNKVLTERRKELLFRGLRWSDLRRFNLEGANITLKRIVNGATYLLPPNDARWVLLIPNLEISQSGIAQNPR
jgi:hypothetical protein